MRVLLVDDHALFREGLASLLSYQDDFDVVGEAGSADAAVEQARSLQPDLILMDIDLAGADGIEAARRITAEMPDMTIVMLTVYDEANKLFEAVKAGAQGYLVKSIRSSELLERLRGLARGEAPIDGRLAARILDEFRRRDAEDAPEADLTARELEILELVAGRLSNREIATQLSLSEHTVKNHLKSILRKLHLRSRQQAAFYGLSHGWIRPPSERGL